MEYYSESEETVQTSFYTIKEKITEELTEKKSRFIANVFYVQNEEKAKNKIEEIKKMYRDARHNVYAYRLENGIEKYSDDGEPSGTAGMPILELIRGEQLCNVLIIVTRFFGGILLGTGGLVRAYSGVAKLAIEKACKIEMKLCSEYKVIAEYDSFNSIQYYCNQHGITILSTQFLEKIEIKVLVVDSYTQKFLHDLNEMTGRNVICEEIQKCFHK